MIRIGDFSKLSRIPIKTLRYYDDVGLLKPVRVDDLTGYRYYDHVQLTRLNRILALKDLGFSLEQIGRLLDAGLSTDQMRGMLILRQTEIRERVQEEMERLQRVEARLKQIEEENNMSKYDVVVKAVEAVRVASVRGVVPTPPDQGSLWQELGRYLEEHAAKTVQPCFSLYHDDENKEHEWDVEVCEPLAGELAGSARVKVRTLPAVKSMACTVHHGPFTTINSAYEALMKWINDNGYHIAGPGREVYLREAAPNPSGGISQADPETVTEVQFPVEK